MSDLNSLIQEIMMSKKFANLKLADGRSYDLTIHYPTLEQKNFAKFLRNKKNDELASVPTRSDIELYIRQNNLWSGQDDLIVEDLKQGIEKLESEAQAERVRSRRNKIIALIEHAKERLQAKLQQYESYFSRCRDTIIWEEEVFYYLKNCVYYIDGAPFWTEELFESCYDNELIYSQAKIFVETIHETFEEPVVRQIARDSEWRLYWRQGKEDVVGLFNLKHIGDLNFRQTQLLNWSYFYDWVYEIYDSPPENIIQDDEALDRWYAKRKEKEKEKDLKNHIEEEYSLKNKKGGEAAIVVQGYYDPEDNYTWKPYSEEEKQKMIENVYGANNRAVRQQRAKEDEKIIKSGTVREEDLRKTVNERQRAGGVLKKETKFR